MVAFSSARSRVSVVYGAGVWVQIYVVTLRDDAKGGEDEDWMSGRMTRCKRGDLDREAATWF